jgi:hypothetical protein
MKSEFGQFPIGAKSTMNEIISIPKSLREQISEAQTLLAQSKNAGEDGNTDLAVIRARAGLEIIQTIAQKNPELGALLACDRLGYRGIEVTTYEEDLSYQVIEQKFLGLSVGTQVVPVRSTRRTCRQVRLI